MKKIDLESKKDENNDNLSEEDKKGKIWEKYRG